MVWTAIAVSGKERHAAMIAFDAPKAFSARVQEFGTATSTPSRDRQVMPKMCQFRSLGGICDLVVCATEHGQQALPRAS